MRMPFRTSASDPPAADSGDRYRTVDERNATLGVKKLRVDFHVAAGRSPQARNRAKVRQSTDWSSRVEEGHTLDHLSETDCDTMAMGRSILALLRLDYGSVTIEGRATARPAERG